MPNKENVADYPRPPLIEFIDGQVSVRIGDEIIVQDTKYIRVCETYHPPAIYIESNAFVIGTLQQTSGRAFTANGRALQSTGH